VRRIAWVFAALVMLPFPLGLVPGTRPLAELVNAPYEWGVDALAALLGLGPPSRAYTGSGDTLYYWLRLLLVAIVAVIAGGAWALAARRRVYPRLDAALRVWLRYWLALAMLGYGLVKVFPMQFDVPLDYIYDQRVGDKSPMGLLWLFMGYSRPYTITCGLVEMFAGCLLIWRRTVTLGALVAIAAMTQVVILNFCYDVPVKLYSLELLAAAFAIAAPDLRRVLIAALGRTVPEVPPRVRGPLWYERARLAGKLALLGSFCLRWYQADAPRLAQPPPSELAGAWDVTSFQLDGNERAPLTTDGERWQRATFARFGLVVRFMPETRGFFRVDVDEARKQLDFAVGVRRETWTYRLANDHLVLDGALADHRYHVELARAPAPLLETRGFHWIQEEPFHR
jgi:hypothetical protein